MNEINKDVEQNELTEENLEEVAGGVYGDGGCIPEPGPKAPINPYEC